MPNKNKELQIHPLTRTLSVRAETLNKVNRSVEVMFSSGAQVMRGGFFDEPFIEELAITPEAMRMDRLNAGAPVLNNHSQHSLNDVLGVVESARLENGEAFATLRFSDRADVEPIFRDIQNRIIRNVSVGYRVHEFKEVGTLDGVPIMRAIDFEPMEISIVPIGADARAQIRSEDKTNLCKITLRGDAMATEEEKKPAPESESEEHKEDQPSKEAPAEESSEESKDESETKEDGEASKEEVETSESDSSEERSGKSNTTRGNIMEKQVEKAVIAERKRASDIDALCSRHAMSEEFAAKLKKEGSSIEGARGLILDELATKTEKTVTRGAVVTSGDYDEKTVAKRGIENHFLNRYDQEKYARDDMGRKFSNMNLIECARSILELEGVRTRNMSKVEIAKRAMHASSDFPELLANVANKNLRDQFAEAPQTFAFMTREITAADFKEISSVKLTDATALEEVLENGEFKDATIGESAEKYKLATFGKILRITQQALINDDMSGFTRLPGLLGRRARDVESDLVWAQITSNPTLSNGNALFSAGNANLVDPGAVPSVAELSKLRALMRLQTEAQGSKLNLPARYLVGPTALETEMEKLVTDIRPDSSGNVNPFANKLQVVVEPRLDDKSSLEYYVMSSKSDVDMIELARLEGESGPVIDTEDSFEVWGMKLRIRHSAAAKVVEHRGMTRNKGEA